MTPETKALWDKALEARVLLRTGVIDYDEAKRRVQPYIDHVNAGGKRVAKQHGGTFRKVSTTGFLR